MEYLYLFIGLLFLLLIKGIYDQRNHEKIVRTKIRNQWGKVPNYTYSEEKRSSLKQFYLSRVNKDRDIDEITWNDLDMDAIYDVINSTSTSIGEEYLYSMLRKLEYNQDELYERNRIIEYFRTHDIEREEMQVAFQQFGKMDKISVYEYINLIDNVQLDRVWVHWLCAIGLPIALCLNFVDIQLGIVATLLMIGNNIMRYYATKAKVSAYFNVLSYIINVLDGVEMIGKIPMKELEGYTSELVRGSKKFKKFRRGSSVVLGGRSAIGGLADIGLDYVRMLFHVDLIKFNSMIQGIRMHQNTLHALYETIGLLDSCIAIASFRTYVKEYCEPQLVHSQKPFIEANNLYHPLIENPVKNSMYQDRSMLITGSNASGKSTFLRTVAINAILSQTIYTSLADTYRGSYFKIYSSMALQDNLFAGESYYMAEIKSLKRILDQMKGDIPVLCFVDEVLRGTNTIERISASAEILHNIASHNVLCMAATHDIELTMILEKEYTNYHFQEEVKNDDVLFDYKLYEGKATSRNAIKLLKMIGYNREIIDAANHRANVFIETGEWTSY